MNASFSFFCEMLIIGHVTFGVAFSQFSRQAIRKLCTHRNKSGNTPGAKAATASTLDITSVRKLLKNKKLQYY